MQFRRILDKHIMPLNLGQLAKAGRRNEILWRYGYNFRPSLKYRFGIPPRTTEVQRKIVRDLDRNGIAFTHVDECCQQLQHFHELETVVEKLVTSRREGLVELERKASHENAIGEKTFNVELLGSTVEYAPDSVFARFATQDFLLGIANDYFQMAAELRYYNVWKTFSTTTKARESQLWHYDREDNYILKVFLYLCDVDSETGPFTYAPGTHRKGQNRNVDPQYFMEGNVRRTTDEQMAKVIDEKHWIRATGPRGTLVFADTRGYHKGGNVRKGSRLMFTSMYTSPASQSRRLLVNSNA